jgi:hypothetical protein
MTTSTRTATRSGRPLSAGDRADAGMVPAGQVDFVLGSLTQEVMEATEVPGRGHWPAMTPDQFDRAVRLLGTIEASYREFGAICREAEAA